MGTFSESVKVVRSAAGALVQLWWRGRCYTLASEPLCWYERRPWWESETRMRPGEGVGYVDTQMWRVQVRQEGKTELLTLDLVRYRPSDRWRVIKIHDAVDEQFKELLEGA